MARDRRLTRHCRIHRKIGRKIKTQRRIPILRKNLVRGQRPIRQHLVKRKTGNKAIRKNLARGQRPRGQQLIKRKVEKKAMRKDLVGARDYGPKRHDHLHWNGQRKRRKLQPIPQQSQLLYCETAMKHGQRFEEWTLCRYTRVLRSI